MDKWTVPSAEEYHHDNNREEEENITAKVAIVRKALKKRQLL